MLRFSKSDELNRDSAPLMEKLEETMLSVGSRLSEINNSSWVVNYFAFRVNSLSIALHIELLDMGCKFAEGLAVRNNGS